jgi:hypothetical protein
MVTLLSHLPTEKQRTWDTFCMYLSPTFMFAKHVQMNSPEISTTESA